MLCRLHLAAPSRSPLRSQILWPRAGSLFDDLEREMDAMWDLLTGDWRPTATSRSSTSSMSSTGSTGSTRTSSTGSTRITSTSSTSTTTGQETTRSPETASDPAAPFAVTQDMTGFDPNELVVKICGEKLVLTGKKATRTPEGPFRYEIFRREWNVPESVDRDRLSCSISSEGKLRIEAPSAEPAPRTVPIEVNRVGNPAEPEPEPHENSRAQG